MQLNEEMTDLLRQMHREGRSYHKDPDGMYEVRAIDANALDEQSSRDLGATMDQALDAFRTELRAALRGQAGYAGMLLLSANWLGADVPTDNDVYFLIHWLESGIPT
jgi:hypothetical protein